MIYLSIYPDEPEVLRPSTRPLAWPARLVHTFTPRGWISSPGPELPRSGYLPIYWDPEHKYHCPDEIFPVPIFDHREPAYVYEFRDGTLLDVTDHFNGDYV